MPVYGNQAFWLNLVIILSLLLKQDQETRGDMLKLITCVNPLSITRDALFNLSTIAVYKLIISGYAVAPSSTHKLLIL